MKCKYCNQKCDNFYIVKIRFNQLFCFFCRRNTFSKVRSLLKSISRKILSVKYSLTNYYNSINTKVYISYQNISLKVYLKYLDLKYSSKMYTLLSYFNIDFDTRTIFLFQLSNFRIIFFLRYRTKILNFKVGFN